jgi:hypothetical protein
MAHFAKLDENNLVLEVHVVNNEDINDLPFPESEPVGIEFLTNWSGGYTNWKQTSYNNNFRFNYAQVGSTYDSENDAFILPKEYPSWILNQTNFQWEAPAAFPNDGKFYVWDEPTLSWKEVVEPNG